MTRTVMMHFPSTNNWWVAGRPAYDQQSSIDPRWIQPTYLVGGSSLELRDSYMDSCKSSLLQEDRLASIRARNKTLITIIFSLIIALALILGGIIISFVLKYNSNSKSPNTNPAVKEFCSASQSKLSCINSLSSSIKTTRHTDPTLVYTLSLEAALQKLSQVDSILSRSNSAVKNCWSSLRVAMRRLDGALAVMRVDPVIETQAFEQRRSMVLLIDKAMDALRSCGKDLDKAGSTALDYAGARVYEVEVLLRNSRYFLDNFDWVDANFRANDDHWSARKILEYFATVSVFGSQYLVLILLFFLLLRK